MSTAIQISDADLDGADNAADEFFRRLVDAEKLSSEGKKEKEDEDEETSGSSQESDDDRNDRDEHEASEEADGDSEESDEGRDEDEGEDSEGDSDSDDDDPEDADKDSKAKTVIDSDDAVVKITVDGKEVEASIKDLKRLYGQEAALTRKSMEAAETKKKAEEAGALHMAGLDAMLQRAQQRFEPYAKLNFLALAKDPNLSAEEFTALHEAAQAAAADVQFIQSEIGNTLETLNKQRHEAMVAQARETHKLLSDPKTGIEGWSEPLYNDIRKFATEQGLSQQIVDSIVDPVGIKILHMAMSYAKAAKATADKAPKKIDKSPKKIVKGEGSETVRKGKTVTKDAAFKKLQMSGSTDDAADAFLARWSS